MPALLNDLVPIKMINKPKLAENKFHFEVWKGLIEAVGYVLLATSFISKLFGKYYEIVIILETVLIIFCAFKMTTSKR